MFVTFFDTCMTTLVALIVWRLSPLIVFVPWLFFAGLDGLYLSSALNKVPEGAWFTLTLSGVLTCLFLLWRFGKENQWRAEAEDRFKLTALVSRDDEGPSAGASSGLRLTPKWGGDSLSNIRGFGVYFDKTGVLTPVVFTQFVSKFVAVTDVSVFFHLHPVETPSVPDEERYAVMRFKEIPGCYRLVVKHGFMDEVISPDLAALVYEQIRNFVVRQALQKEAATDVYETAQRGVDRDGSTHERGDVAISRGSHTITNGQEEQLNEALGDKSAAKVANEDSSEGHPEDKSLPIELRNARVAAELARLDRAFATRIMYVVGGKEQMHISSGTSLWRKAALGTFLWIRDNTRAKIANLRLAMDRVVEIGFVKEI